MVARHRHRRREDAPDWYKSIESVFSSDNDRYIPLRMESGKESGLRLRFVSLDQPASKHLERFA